jgi:small subunit ribosomal protein S4
MAKKLGAQCKICRREGKKLFLKGERCFTSKCALVKRNFPPGMHGVKGRGRLTSYGIQLREKQQAKQIYGISERQLRNYFKKATQKKGDTSEFLLQLLESRLDNVVYRLGFAKSRKIARQLVNHGHFLVNNKKVTIPSYQAKPNDIITLREKSLKSAFFADLPKILEKVEVPNWLFLDVKKMEGKVLNKPDKNTIVVPFDINKIIEFYSR